MQYPREFEGSRIVKAGVLTLRDESRGTPPTWKENKFLLAENKQLYVVNTSPPEKLMEWNLAGSSLRLLDTPLEGKNFCLKIALSNHDVVYCCGETESVAVEWLNALNEIANPTLRNNDAQQLTQLFELYQQMRISMSDLAQENNQLKQKLEIQNHTIDHLKKTVESRGRVHRFAVNNGNRDKWTVEMPSEPFGTLSAGRYLVFIHGHPEHFFGRLILQDADTNEAISGTSNNDWEALRHNGEHFFGDWHSPGSHAMIFTEDSIELLKETRLKINCQKRVADPNCFNGLGVVFIRL
jgi:hypothetical protein